MSASALSDWLAQRLDRGAPQPLVRQLHDLLLQGVVGGELAPGARLPSSRLLAAELKIARNTVVDVYQNLIAQGCLVARAGSGTCVADLSADRPAAAPKPAAAPAPAPRPAALSERGRQLLAGAGVSARQWGAFMPGVPDVREFPVRVWTRLHNRQWRGFAPERLSYGPGGGLPALRAALAGHLRASRSVHCEPAQVIVTTGTHQSVDLAARLLADPGDRVGLEDPCYWGLRSSLLSLGLRPLSMAVDGEGLVVPARAAAPRLVIATPSHQYPLGMVMSLARRQALLDYARRHGCWIVEDDYDSEFRYGSRPIASLQSLDGGERVIYVGSFSKTLFPGLRLGYIVVPPGLAEAFAKGSAELYREGQMQQQAVLADFIAEGHLGAHIRRMRALYGARRQCLLAALKSHFGSALEVAGDNAGLHLVLRLPDAVDDKALAADALAAGILVRPLSGYYSERGPAPSGLLLGYAGVNEGEIVAAFEVLARVLRRHGV